MLGLGSVDGLELSSEFLDLGAERFLLRLQISQILAVRVQDTRLFFAEELLSAVLGSACALAVWLLLFTLLRQRWSALATSRLATLLAYAPPVLLSLHGINEVLLPGFFDAPSLLWNAALLPLGAGFLWLLSAGLRRWQEDAWIAGRAWPPALALLLVAPLGAYFAGPGHARDPEPDGHGEADPGPEFLDLLVEGRIEGRTRPGHAEARDIVEKP